MTHSTTRQPHPSAALRGYPQRGAAHQRAGGTGPDMPVGDPPLFPEVPPSTGTVDDDDEPEDEHDDENEASVREPHDRTMQ